ncbi:hypothetical protein GCM10009647_087580 [Streptomyces sanglieri]
MSENNTNRLPDYISYYDIDRIFLLGMRYLSYSIDFHDRVSSSHPVIASLFFQGTKACIRTAAKTLRSLVPPKYTDADPYKIFSVDPDNIQRTTGEPFSKRRGWVVNGDWDKRGQPFMERVCPKAIKQRYVDELEWDDTILADHYSGRKYKRRCERIERLYRSIHSDGYRTQQELLSENPSSAWDGLNDAMHPLANEIAVDIGRNGEFLWNMCGQHRLAIAKVLDVEEVCVQVFRRHKDWQQIRDRIQANGDVPDKLRDHPDLQDVLKSK